MDAKLSRAARPRGTRPQLESDAFAAAEAIASRDCNNLYLTSSFFADGEKYRAFCAFYAVMRVVDDRIDGLPSRGLLSNAQRLTEQGVLSAWSKGVEACYATGSVPNPVVDACARHDAQLLFKAFADSLGTFRPPQVLWDSFFGAMRWDLEHDRFESWQQFLTYAEGASVAPTTIYLFLLVARRVGESTELPDGFNVAECGRQLGLFAYIGHILRDLAEDLRTGQNGFLYVSREDMAAHGVTEELLLSDVETGQASTATRGLVAELVSRARQCLSEGRTSMACLSGQLDQDCSFILELIVTVYECVLDKIEACSHDPMGDAHRLTVHEKQGILSDVADRCGYRPDRRLATATRRATPT